MKFTNHLWTLISITQHTRIFWGVWELVFIAFNGLFFEILTPSTLGGHNFLNSILFFMTLNVLEAPIEGFKFCLNTRNNGPVPLDMACPKRLSVIVTIELQLNLQLNKQLKDWIHMFYLWIPCYKLYKKRLVISYSHIKIQMPFWDEL